MNNISLLKDVGGTIVQGRYDMICPPRAACWLADNWRAVNLHIVDAGHAETEPEICSMLVRATDDLRFVT